METLLLQTSLLLLLAVVLRQYRQHRAVQHARRKHTRLPK
jgi:hypothetical protein